MLVNEFLERSAKDYPDKEALVFEDIRLTYQELDHASNKLANVLLSIRTNA